MTQPVALLIDDEPDILELLSITLLRMGLDYTTAENTSQAKSLIDKKNFDLCLTDMKLPDGSGMEILQYIQQKQPNTPVAVLTAHGNMETAIEAMKLGAFDFISKPVDLTSLRALITSALKVKKVAPSAEKTQDASGDRQFIGNK